ncbi:MAG TPA: thiolase family protein [Syntrophomonas sp.]|nr:thiolase family protein [Syntrophomonas sp.]
MREAVIVSAVRTPVGRCRGALASVPSYELGALAVKEAVERAGINPEEIDEVIFGNLMNSEINNMARMVALTAGLPFTVPGIALDRQCATGLNAIAYAAMLIQAGHGNIMVAGGAESDSGRCYLMEKPTAPYQVVPPQWAEIKTGPGALNVPMGITAENLAEQYGITRQECDEFSVLSHQKADKAWKAGYFNDQIVPVPVSLGKGKTTLVTMDETVRPDTSRESLAKLPPAFKKDGVVTAGNSSPMSDGSGAVVVMEKEAAKSGGHKILAKFKSYAAVGVDPAIMGIGPVYAVRKVLKQTGMTLGDIDLIEMNEAFASQSIACIRDLNMDMDKLNVNGGAIALGHPLAGTGGILAAKIINELHRRDLQTGLITFCCGGGQGVAVIIERE